MYDRGGLASFLVAVMRIRYRRVAREGRFRVMFDELVAREEDFDLNGGS
jgi:hypothetical protein